MPVGQTLTWTGGGNNDDWTNSSNWDTSNYPATSGDSLVFGLNNVTSYLNGEGTPYSFANISITGNNNALTVTQNTGFAITNSLSFDYSGSGLASSQFDMTFGSGSTLTVGQNDVFDVTGGGSVIAPSSVSKQGAGTLKLSSDGSTGYINLDAGIVEVDGQNSGLHVNINSANTVLSGAGTVGAVSFYGGSITPGVNTLGTLTIAGNAYLGGEGGTGTIGIELNSTSQYDQLAVNGTVALNNTFTHLDVTALTGNTIQAGDVFTIINNDSTDAISGTFVGLAEGAEVTTSNDSNKKFIISYIGGDGNDVTLTAETWVNRAPVVTIATAESTFDDLKDAPSVPVYVDNNITVRDVDNATLASATISITGNYQPDQDVLSFNNYYLYNYYNTGNITGHFDSTTGQLTLTSEGATATVAQWQNALQLVYYDNTSGYPNTDDRTISFTVNDGALDSTAVTSTIHVTQQNDTPLFFAGGIATTHLDTSILLLFAGFAGNVIGESIQSDGKILVTANNFLGNSASFVTSRYNTDGSLDTSFGTDGVVTTLINSVLGFSSSVTSQTDGKILVVGTGAGSNSADFALVRYNSDGSLDSGFGTGGVVTTDIGDNTDDWGVNLALQTDNKILVAGSSQAQASSSNVDFALTRYNADGSLDTSFGTGGKVITDLGTQTDDRISNIAIQTDGKILALGGHTVTGGTNTYLDPALVRYNPDGSLDTSFGTGGIVTANLNTNIDFLIGNDLIVQSDSKILVSSSVQNANGDPDFALIRYNSDGSLDTSYGKAGVVTTDFKVSANIGSSNGDVSESMALQADGKVVVAGFSFGFDSTYVAFSLARYNPDGSLDNGFGDNGKVITHITGADLGLKVSIQSDGKIVVAGYSGDPAYGFMLGKAVLARYNTDGSPDNSFGASDNSLNYQNTLNTIVGFTEDSSAVVLSKSIMIFDAELNAIGNYDGTTLTLVRDGGANAEDVFANTGTLATLTEGENLVVDGTTIGTVTTNSAGTLALSFNANATQSLINSVLEQITYRNTSQNPPESVKIDWAFDDGNTTGIQGPGGALTGMASTTVNIVTVDDVTVATVSADATTFNEVKDLPSTAVTINSGIALSDLDNTTLASATVSITENYHSNQDVLLFANDTTDMGNIVGSFNKTTGVLSLQSAGNTATLTQWENALKAVQYTNTSDAPNTDNRTVSFVVNDGSVDSTAATKTVSVTAINDTPSFNIGTGSVMTAVGTGNDTAKAVTVQADGKYIELGHTHNSDGHDYFGLVRYNADGTLDTSFGTNGIVTTDIGSGDDQAKAIVIAPDGKFLVTGFSFVGSHNQVSVARYEADGTLDTSFGTNGYATTAAGGIDDRGKSITLQTDGKIVVSGLSKNGAGSFDLVIVRYNPDGTVDTSFDTDGVAITPVTGGLTSSTTFAVSATPTATDDLITVNSVISDRPSGSNLPLITTTYDTSAGFTVTANSIDASLAPLYTNALYNQLDGKSVVASSATNGSDLDFVLTRHNADGSLDTSFNALNNTLGNSVSFTEDSTAVVLDASVAISDADLNAIGNYNGATLTLARDSGANTQDVFSKTGTLGALTQGSNLIVDSKSIGAVTTNSAGTLVLTFNTNATQALVNSALEKIAYSNSSHTPPASVQLDWTFSDGNSTAQGTGGALTATGSTTVNITSVNDAPTGSVTISDSNPYQGENLTVSNTIVDLDGLSSAITYTWYVSGSGSSVATGTSYTPTVSDIGKTISVTASYTDDVGTAESVNSAPTANVSPPNLNLGGDTSSHNVPRYDTLTGANGDDTLNGYMLSDSLSGAGGDDKLYGGYGNDTLNGGDGNDLLLGEGGFDKIVGCAGNDTLDGGADIDTIDGGAGSDIYYQGYADMDAITDTGPSCDTDTLIVPYQVTRYTLPSGIENGIIAAGTRTYNTFSAYGTVNAASDTLTGNASNNVLTGNEGNNALNGDLGNDTLIGNAGKDTLSGGSGNDNLCGGADNDIIDGGLGNDTLTGGVGQDIFRFADSISTSNIDNICDFVVVDDTIQLSHTSFTALSVSSSNYFHLGSAAAGANDFILYNPSTGVLSYDADANGKGSAMQIITLGTSLALTNADFVVI